MTDPANKAARETREAARRVRDYLGLDSTGYEVVHKAIHDAVADERARWLKRLLAEANARYEAMTPEEQAEMWKAQRESWVRGEMALGLENGKPDNDR